MVILLGHVGRNLEQQCVGKIEQMVPEIEKRGKEDTIIVQVGTNNNIWMRLKR